MGIIKAVFYPLSFIILWYSAGIIISIIERFAKRLNLSPFAFSFFVLGILTSIPEFSVGINSILEKTPDIFIGNLIGASLMFFIFIIPLLAIFGGSVKMLHQLSENDMIFALLVVAAPIFLIADNLLTRTEGVFLIIIYGVLFYFIEKKRGLMSLVKDVSQIKDKPVIEDWIYLIVAILVTFLTSRFIVSTTIDIANFLKISPFVISIILLPIGSNLPELSLAIKSILVGRKEIALGDYLGSAAANTLLFGILTLLNGARINVNNYSLRTLIIYLIGLGLFFIFAKSKKEISSYEGKILLLVYLLFVLTEVVL